MNKNARDLRKASLATPSNLGENAVKDISAVLAALLADMFALYLKTKNFHWHVSGPHFRDYHLLLDEQAAEIFATTDEIAERVEHEVVGHRSDRDAQHPGLAGPHAASPPPSVLSQAPPQALASSRTLRM